MKGGAEVECTVRNDELRRWRGWAAAGGAVAEGRKCEAKQVLSHPYLGLKNDCNFFTDVKKISCYVYNLVSLRKHVTCRLNRTLMSLF